MIPISSNGAAKDLSEAQEFFAPRPGTTLADYVAAGDIGGIHHLARYEWLCGAAGELGAPRRVIDIACGAGYGSAMLARALPGATVLGSDYDARAIEWSWSHHAAANLSFAVGNMVTWEFEQPGLSLGRFDLVVSFDTIEHLLHREIALMRIADNLSDDGIFVFSTPCAHTVSQLNPGWEHHKIEYSHTDLLALMRRFFHEVLVPQDPAFPNRGFWDRLNARGVIYPNLANPLVCRVPVRV